MEIGDLINLPLCRSRDHTTLIFTGAHLIQSDMQHIITKTFHFNNLGFIFILELITFKE